MQGTLSSSRQIDTEKVKLQGITLLTTRFYFNKTFCQDERLLMSNFSSKKEL